MKKIMLCNMDCHNYHLHIYYSISQSAWYLLSDSIMQNSADYNNGQPWGGGNEKKPKAVAVPGAKRDAQLQEYKSMEPIN